MIGREIEDLIAQAKRAPLDAEVWQRIHRISERTGAFPDELDAQFVSRIVQLSKTVTDRHLALTLAQIRAKIAGVDLVHIPAGDFIHVIPHGMSVYYQRGGYQQSAEVIYRPEFWITRDMVTVGSYAAFLSKISKPDRKAYKPSDWNLQVLTPTNSVIGVCSDQAEGFAKFFGLSLPYKTEWSKAGRGDDGRPFPWGFDPLDVPHAWNRPAEIGEDGRQLPEEGEDRKLVSMPNGYHRPWGQVRRWLVRGPYPGSESPYGIRGMVGYWGELVLKDQYFKDNLWGRPYGEIMGDPSTCMYVGGYRVPMCSEVFSRQYSWSGFRLVYAPNRSAYSGVNF